MINIIVERSSGDRRNLYNELINKYRKKLVYGGSDNVSKFVRDVLLSTLIYTA